MGIREIFERAERTNGFSVQGILIDVAEHLYCYRVGNNFTKADMARRLNMTRSGYQNLEAAKYAFSIKTLVKIAAATDSEVFIFFRKREC